MPLACLEDVTIRGYLQRQYAANRPDRIDRATLCVHLLRKKSAGGLDFFTLAAAGGAALTLREAAVGA